MAHEDRQHSARSHRHAADHTGEDPDRLTIETAFQLGRHAGLTEPAQVVEDAPAGETGERLARRAARALEQLQAAVARGIRIVPDRPHQSAVVRLGASAEDGGARQTVGGLTEDQRRRMHYFINPEGIGDAAGSLLGPTDGDTWTRCRDEAVLLAELLEPHAVEGLRLSRSASDALVGRLYGLAHALREQVAMIDHHNDAVRAEGRGARDRAPPAGGRDRTGGTALAGWSGAGSSWPAPRGCLADALAPGESRPVHQSRQR